MTTRPDHHEPLDAEERDLAARLGRVGPFDGPSSALDAKILAAARTAAATRAHNRRRHFAWLGVPPALVTGVGVAAAAVLALGLVWQMRPQYGEIAAHGEAADAGEDEIVLIAPMDPAKTPVNPPPFPEPQVARAPVERAAAAAPVADGASISANAKATASAPTAEQPAAPSAAPADAGLLAAKPEAPAEEKLAESAPAMDGFVAEPPGAAPMRKSRATYTTSARATAERRARAGISTQDAAAPPAPAPVAAAAPSASESDTTLDRIEVTGSRVALSEVPVSEDSHLPIEAWLLRIRARRDEGHLEDARASLTLFRREYPRVRLPADLRALLIDSKR